MPCLKMMIRGVVGGTEVFAWISSYKTRDLCECRGVEAAEWELWRMYRGEGRGLKLYQRRPRDTNEPMVQICYRSGCMILGIKNYL